MRKLPASPHFGKLSLESLYFVCYSASTRTFEETAISLVLVSPELAGDGPGRDFGRLLEWTFVGELHGHHLCVFCCTIAELEQFVLVEESATAALGE